MSIYNYLLLTMKCPRCGIEGDVEAEFRFGLRELTRYRLGDTLCWDGKGIKTPRARPEDGNYQGEAYVVCPSCQRDYWLTVSVNEDVIASASIDSTRQAYIPDSLQQSEAQEQSAQCSRSSNRQPRNRAVEEIDWVEIPGGEFLFGLSERQAEQFLDDLPFNIRSGSDPKWLSRLQNEIRRETPQKQVNLETFYISRYPITCQQYLPFAQGDHPFADRNLFSGKDLETVLNGLRSAAEETGDHPASVTWHSAVAFCEWIGARLPTSAEWEKAARGAEGYMYPWGNSWDARRGNFTTDRVRWPHKTSPVTAYPTGQSPYGVMDLMGNAYELTLSTFLLEAEYVLLRGTSCNFDTLMDQQYNPTWFRNRVTAYLGNAMNFGGSTDPVGFRPVLDRWQARAWAGFG